MTFEPIKYVIPGVIVEGLTLLAGKPKLGKSWLLLHAAIAVARGGYTLGEIHCIEGDVLYCALEDNLRRLQSRMTKLLGMPPWSMGRLSFQTEMPRLAEGGLDLIKQWIETAEHPRLVIIDTLAMVRAPKKKEQTQYDSDYAAVLELRALAAEHKIAIVVVHHLRKAEADDALDTVSGTLGLTGAVDTVIVLKRDAGTIVMHGRGRDLIDVEKAVSFDKESCLWRIAGDAAVLRLTNERATIVQAITEASEPVGPREIADTTGMRAQNIRRLLGKLLKEGTIAKAGYGKYRPAVLPM
jgi:RecA-family ATPase